MLAFDLIGTKVVADCFYLASVIELFAPVPSAGFLIRAEWLDAEESNACVSPDLASTARTHTFLQKKAAFCTLIPA